MPGAEAEAGRRTDWLALALATVRGGREVGSPPAPARHFGTTGTKRHKAPEARAEPAERPQSGAFQPPERLFGTIGTNGTGGEVEEGAATARALAEPFGQPTPAEAEPEVGGGERKLRASAKVAARTSPLRDGDALAALFEAEERRDATDEPIPRDVAEAFGEAYARHLSAIANATSHPHGRRYLATAARFCADGWAARALALGWGTQALFALHPTRPWERLDALGAAYLAREPVAVTADTIRLASGLTARPRPCRGGVVL